MASFVKGDSLQRIDDKDAWKMKFLGKWKLINRENAAEFLAWEGKSTIVIGIAKMMPHTFLFEMLNNDINDKLHLHMTGFPFGDITLTAGTVSPQEVIDGSKRQVDFSFEWDEERKIMITTSNDVNHPKQSRVSKVEREILEDGRLKVTTKITYKDGNNCYFIGYLKKKK